MSYVKFQRKLPLMRMASMNKEKLWTKEFISISVVNFFLMLSMYLLLVTMATYASDEYNASSSTAGLVASIFILGALSGRFFAGKQMEKLGSRKILLGGTVFFIIVTLFYFLPTNIYGLMAIRFFHGIGVGFATTATGTIAAHVIPSSRNGEGIGYFSLSAVLSTASWTVNRDCIDQLCWLFEYICFYIGNGDC